MQLDLFWLESQLGHTFRDKTLLILAFVHRSYVNESRSITAHNERLEFLGDMVLGLVVSDYLYHHYPHLTEGELSALRARLVEASACMSYLNRLGVASALCLGKGEQLNKGRGRESILADLFEAIMGAIYLDSGFEAASRFFFGHFTAQVEEIVKTPLRNWKAFLQDYCQKHYQQIPHYQVVGASGPDHCKRFEVIVLIHGREYGKGEGLSKKEAEQAAAADACHRLQVM